MSLLCHVVAGRLVKAEPDTPLGRPFDGHVSGCLTCQAEAARYRKLCRSLASLADRAEQPPVDFAADVAAALGTEEEATGRATRVGRAAATTGAIAATAAGVIAVAIWRRARHAA